MKLKVLILTMGLNSQGVALAITPGDILGGTVLSEGESEPEVIVLDNGSSYASAIPDGKGGLTDWVFSADGKERFDCTVNPKECRDLLGSKDGNGDKGDEGGNTGAEGGNTGAEGGEKPKKTRKKNKDKKSSTATESEDTGNTAQPVTFDPLQSLREKVKTDRKKRHNAKPEGAKSSRTGVEHQEGNDINPQSTTAPRGFVDSSTVDVVQPKAPKKGSTGYVDSSTVDEMKSKPGKNGAAGFVDSSTVDVVQPKAPKKGSTGFVDASTVDQMKSKSGKPEGPRGGAGPRNPQGPGPHGPKKPRPKPRPKPHGKKGNP